MAATNKKTLRIGDSSFQDADKGLGWRAVLVLLLLCGSYCLSLPSNTTPHLLARPPSLHSSSLTRTLGHLGEFFSG
ncbi:hypothetical protein VTJ04DRAFT_10891 [Mycothermus thermophilus]|uniref:uncharacterized protein n=1 Tax=Humicola insolens TaxID=85995 RepID=UPI0037439073